ncbi:PadR family transcriptional regulator [Paenarthrobacter histidinolovorans]|uniref:DNA-binding PadR family transcriptional regulator n=1 Tax=Paenarthrobacter histidinolovorans TaxID=43664 RepID=A0ABW8NAF1_9MICC|nr:PadR family transcriptional regulator [Paenarthrobacter histidinolovorans]GGJ30710.1 transcriptional regulator [Paenarthrobacter histidinolovorans]
MSIRHSLLALLQDQPRYGYELRVEFEDRTGAAWPLNIGQVYTTLDRLERDGLVSKDGDDGGGHVVYSITDAGVEEVAAWFSGAVDRGNPPRNEIAIKLALAVTMPGVDAAAVIQSQREVSVKALQEHTQARKAVSANQRSADTAFLLVLDSLVFQAEAEVRWLDLCEARMVQTLGKGGSNSAGPG